jgi:hypothetical protein
MSYSVLFCPQSANSMAIIQCCKRWRTDISLEQWTVLLSAAADRHATCDARQHSLFQMAAWQASWFCVLGNVRFVSHTQHSLRTSHTLQYRRLIIITLSCQLSVVTREPHSLFYFPLICSI